MAIMTGGMSCIAVGMIHPMERVSNLNARLINPPQTLPKVVFCQRARSLGTYQQDQGARYEAPKRGGRYFCLICRASVLDETDCEIGYNSTDREDLPALGAQLDLGQLGPAGWTHQSLRSVG